jgi:penicillin-binding protein 1C
MRDNWCLGFSDRYTVGVWVGNGGGEPMWNVSGVDGAAPVWRGLMDALHAGEPSRGPAVPSDVVATAQGFTLRGTEPPSVAAGVEAARVTLSSEPSAPAMSRIVSPAPGLVIAIDPDIPTTQQRVLIEVEPPNADLALVLDGDPLGAAGTPHLWSVARGRHELILSGQAGREIDRVAFVVR